MKQNASNGKQKKNRNATAAVMVLALGAAVYLNWSFAKEAPQDLTVTTDTPCCGRNRGLGRNNRWVGPTGRNS